MICALTHENKLWLYWGVHVKHQPYPNGRKGNRNSQWN